MYGLGRHLSHLTQILKITVVPTTHGCSTYNLGLDEMFAKMAIINGGNHLCTLQWFSNCLEYVPGFKFIQFLIPEEEDFSKLFTIFRRGGHLGDLDHVI